MELIGLSVAMALISGAVMFFLGFLLGQKTAERRSRLYQRIREV